MSVRGYADWRPKPEALGWVRRAGQVLNAYRDYWPLSVRQIFYRLVADHGYEKTEAAYSKLTTMLSRARRAGLLPWDAIRDGGLGRSVPPNYYDNAADFQQVVRKQARGVRLNRQDGQQLVVELWCEAGGMVPILERIAEPYVCRVNTGGGYDSVTAKHRLAERVRDRAQAGLRTVVLHVGDFDGSGEDMAAVLRDDTMHMVVTQVIGGVAAPERLVDVRQRISDGRASDGDLAEVASWALGFFWVERVALMGEQVLERQVITAPPKPSDSRTAKFLRRNRWVADALGTEDISAQLEALTPPELSELISGAIEGHLDMEAYARALSVEDEARGELEAWVARADNGGGRSS